jgi:hypothetical protein
MKLAEDLKFEWYDIFWKYVHSGFYQAFVRDLKNLKTKEEIREINRFIRQVYVDRIKNDFIEFGSISLADDDSTVIVQDDSFMRAAEPKFVRLMVGNHGPYIEFTEPENKGQFVRKNLQYNYYRRDGKKLYDQFKTVNYAEYKIGMWYIDLYSAMNLPTPTEEEFKR